MSCYTILSKPKNAIIKQYKKLFELDGVELEIEDDALIAIAKKAVERNIGARGLRSIIENVMMDSMFNIPSDNTVKKCIITKDAVEGKADPTVVHGDPEPQKKITKRTTRKTTGGEIA